MEDQNAPSVPNTGTIDRSTVDLETSTGEVQSVPLASGETETDTLVRTAETEYVVSALKEGKYVADIEQSLVDEKGLEPYDARSVLLDGLQPGVDKALESMDEPDLKEAMVNQLGYSEELVNDIFSTPDEAIGRYRPPILNDVVPGGKADEEDLTQLTAAARNMHLMQMPILQGAVSYLTEDKAGMQKFNRSQLDLSYAVANTLRKMGRNIDVDKRGDLVEVTEAGTVPVDESVLYDIAASENEIIGGTLASIYGYKALNTLSNTPGFGKFGWLAKKAAVLGGTAIAGGTGASVGRSLDILHSAMKTQEDVNAQFVAKRMTDAGVFSATLEIIGTPVIAGGAKLLKLLGRSYDMFIEGNKQGAYKALKDLQHLDDEQVKKIIKEWEQVTGQKAEGSLAKQALTIIPQTEPGGEAIIRSAAGLNPKSSSAIARSINTRAKDLLYNTSRMTNDNIGTVMNDELDKYVKSVKDYYTGVKDIASDATKNSNYRFDYDKLAIDPLMERIHSSLTNPAIQDRFALYMNKVRTLGNVKPKGTTKTIKRPFARSGPKETKVKVAPKADVDTSQLRSFEDLLELRRTVNEFKTRTKIVNKKDFEAVGSVINTLDREIARVAKANPDMGASWNKAWKQANIEYSKMFTLKENVLFKALTNAGKKKKGLSAKKIVKAMVNNITSIDGTFMSVLGKLPPNVRAQAEGAVIDALTKKHTIGFESGLQATHFTNLAEELRHVGFTTPNARELKRGINKMAEVFKNDVELSLATGQVARPQFQSYLTTDPVIRLKYEIASSAFNYVKRLLPGSKGETIALVTNVAKLMENPANSKAMSEVLRSLPLDHELQPAIRRLALEYSKFGEKEMYPKVPLYRTGVPGSMAKAKNGPLGRGQYWSTSKKAIRARARVTGGKVVKENILPSRIATEQNIKDVLGVEDFEMVILKDNKELQTVLKNQGYDGLSIGEEVLIFK